MNFHIITIFPESIKKYFDASILGKARKKGLIKLDLIDLKKYASGKYNKLDDKPYGGGPGMVMKAEPIVKAVKSISKSKPKAKIILLSPAGKQFDQTMARGWAKKYKNIILICGRYEGVDARVKKIFKAEEISVGPYILTGGELPAAVIVDAVARHVSGALGKEESLEEFRGAGFPVYTRPESFEANGEKYPVPKVLLSGNHQKIKEWREKYSKKL